MTKSPACLRPCARGRVSAQNKTHLALALVLQFSLPWDHSALRTGSYTFSQHARHNHCDCHIDSFFVSFFLFCFSFCLSFFHSFFLSFYRYTDREQIMHNVFTGFGTFWAGVIGRWYTLIHLGEVLVNDAPDDWRTWRLQESHSKPWMINLFQTANRTQTLAVQASWAALWLATSSWLKQLPKAALEVNFPRQWH